MKAQEWIAFGIVALAFLAVLIRFYRSFLAGPISSILLKRGKVKLAMKVRSQSKGAGCDNCGPSGDGCH